MVTRRVVASTDFTTTSQPAVSASVGSIFFLIFSVDNCAHASPTPPIMSTAISVMILIVYFISCAISFISNLFYLITILLPFFI